MLSQETVSRTTPTQTRLLDNRRNRPHIPQEEVTSNCSVSPVSVYPCPFPTFALLTLSTFCSHHTNATTRHRKSPQVGSSTEITPSPTVGHSTHSREFNSQRHIPTPPNDFPTYPSNPFHPPLQKKKKSEDRNEQGEPAVT